MGDTREAGGELRELLRNWIVIGISGVTCGGKTSLTERLQAVLRPVYVFNQDRYFLPDDSPRHVRCEGLDHNNYDILSALDMELMWSDIVSTLRGEDRSQASRGEEPPGRAAAPGKKFLIVEGFTVLNYDPIFDICDLRYYLVLTREQCRARRALRRYSPPDVAGYFERCVWPEHERHRRALAARRGLALLDGAAPAPERRVLRDLRALGAAPPAPPPAPPAGPPAAPAAPPAAPAV